MDRNSVTPGRPKSSPMAEATNVVALVSAKPQQAAEDEYEDKVNPRETYHPFSVCRPTLGRRMNRSDRRSQTGHGKSDEKSLLNGIRVTSPTLTRAEAPQPII